VYICCVGVKQGVRQMNIHLHIIAARVLNNFGVKGTCKGDAFFISLLSSITFALAKAAAVPR
jgi:hypothetical protein